MKTKIKDSSQSLEAFMEKYPPDIMEPFPGYKMDRCRAIAGDRAEAFSEWMRGQTCGVGNDGRVYVYPYDIWRFCVKSFHTDWWD